MPPVSAPRPPARPGERAAPSAMRWTPSGSPISHSAPTGMLPNRITAGRMPSTPLASIHIQFSSGLTVSARMMRAMPSTSECTISSSEITSGPGPTFRASRNPTTAASAAGMS